VTVGFQGTTTIKRSEFGVAYGIPMVSDTVKLDISVAFEKKPA
jgi:polyisoprenoid-binding protein YceI